MYGYYNECFALVLETAKQASLETAQQARIEIPSGLCGRFIGKGGEHVSKLQERSGCIIRV